jgi:hypothetical protein
MSTSARYLYAMLWRWPAWAVSMTAAALASGCVGDIGDGPPSGPSEAVEGVDPSTAIPRLSRREIEATISDVFGIVGAAERNLAADPKVAVNPATQAEEEVFDTLSATKTASQVFVDGLESLAFEVARDFSADKDAVDDLAGCVPSGTPDEACLDAFIRNVGQRLWRRPLSDEEVAALIATVAPLATDPAAAEDGHYVAVRGAIASLIVSPELVHRTEIGTPRGRRRRRARGPGAHRPPRVLLVGDGADAGAAGAGERRRAERGGRRGPGRRHDRRPARPASDARLPRAVASLHVVAGDGRGARRGHARRDRRARGSRARRRERRLDHARHLRRDLRHPPRWPRTTASRSRPTPGG